MVRSAAAVVSYLTALALKQAPGLGRLWQDNSDQQILAAVTDLNNTVAAQAQTDQVLRRLQADVAAGAVGRRTQAQLELAVEDSLERDDDFGRSVIDELNKIRALDARRASPLLREAARELKAHDALRGAIHTHRGYQGANTALTLAAAGGVCAVVIVGGSIIVINRGDTPSPPVSSASIPSQESQEAPPVAPAATGEPAFGPAIDIQANDGFRYRVQATALTWETETSSGVAPPGEGFPTLTIRSRNLLEDRPAPDPLIGDSALAGLLFPESSDSAVGSGCPAGLPVLKIAARGRPIGRCFDPVVVEATQTASTEPSEGNELAPSASRDLVLTTETPISTDRDLSALQFWAEFNNSSGFVRLPSP